MQLGAGGALKGDARGVTPVARGWRHHRAGTDDGGVRSNRNSRFHLLEEQPEIHLRFLADDEVDAAANGLLETGFAHAYFVLSDGERKDKIATGLVA